MGICRKGDKNRVSVVGLLPIPARKVRGLARGFQGFFQTSETPLRAKPKDCSGTSVSSWFIFSDDCQPQCIPLHPGRASGLQKAPDKHVNLESSQSM